MKTRKATKKYDMDSAIQFSIKIDFMTLSLHRDHPPVWELT